MKWTCERCKAINAALSFTCHNCGLSRPEDNGPHQVGERVVGASPALGAPYDGKQTFSESHIWGHLIGGRVLGQKREQVILESPIPQAYIGIDFAVKRNQEVILCEKPKEKVHVFERLLKWIRNND